MSSKLQGHGRLSLAGPAGNVFDTLAGDFLYYLSLNHSYREDIVNTRLGRRLGLRVLTDMAFLPLATSFFEKGALAMGLGQHEATALELATEELFVYLCRNSSPDNELDLDCVDGKYYILAEFSCPIREVDLRFFNITASISPDDDASLERMGLLIASRFVDRFHVKKGPEQGILLSLVKEKSYPTVQAGTFSPPSLDQFTIKRPDPEPLKIFAQSVCACYPAWLVPEFMRYPGKLADMFASGEYEAALAFGPQGQVGGGMIWCWAGHKTIRCYGPYVFGQRPGSPMPEALLDACIGAIGKTYAVGLVNTFAPEQLPKEHFETLGALTLYDENGSGTDVTAYFRQMQEDPGTSSWCHPGLEDFLRRQYERLVLPREVQTVSDQGESQAPYSVLSAHFERPQKRVTLRPIHAGKDAEENLADHLKLFGREGIQNVFFEMDLGIPWQAAFTPGLLRSGFTPRMIIPYGGEGDRIVFQLGI